MYLALIQEFSLKLLKSDMRSYLVEDFSLFPADSITFVLKSRSKKVFCTFSKVKVEDVYFY